MDDFGPYTLWLRILGTVLILIVIGDVIYKKDNSSVVCKILLFPLFLMFKFEKSRRERKLRKRKDSYVYPWIW